MKYGERITFEFKKAMKVIMGMVHTHTKYYRIPINALDATPVRGDKGTEGKPPERKCPFIVVSPDSNNTTYRSCHDKTYGTINCCITSVDNLLEIVPDFVAKNEMDPTNSESKNF